MSAWGVLPAVAGVAVLALVAWDVFITVLQHWRGIGPIGERFASGVWRMGVGALSGVSAPRRRRWLGFLGPMLIPLLLALWSGLTILGFALLYLPWLPQGFTPGTGVPAPAGLADALYFSGVSFFTIGYGDLVSVRGGLRALGVLEGGSGFALVTLGISYFAAVYGAYSVQRSLALGVHALADERPDAARLLASLLDGGMPSALLASELCRIRDQLAAVVSGYGTYPILHYFVARTQRESLLRLLFVLHDVGLLLDTAVSPVHRPELAGLGRRSGLDSTLGLARAGMVEALVAEDPRREAAQGGAAFIERRWAERFDLARRTLRAAGVEVREGHDAVEAYCAGRREWEPELRAAARALGDDWEEVSGGF